VLLMASNNTGNLPREQRLIILQDSEVE